MVRLERISMLILLVLFIEIYKLNFVKRYGLDLMDGKIRDNRACGVFEPAMSKVKCLKFATEAAITILRIDDMIKLAPEDKGQDPHAGM